MLKLEHVNTYYGDLQALWDVSLEVNEGEFVALIGPNGAGKTTTLRTISGLLKTSSGSISLEGQNLVKKLPNRIVELGICQVPECGKIFTGMTVLENLELGAYISKARKEKDKNIKWVYELFPRLDERKKQSAGTLSGGERQMLAIARALMSKPKLLLLDEPSFGLAPILVNQIFEIITEINRQGVTILLVEQNIRAALELACKAYLLENGRIVGQGSCADLLTFESVKSAYLG
jgi:branched-chain amino acid transport system ATP-binding protein